MRFERECIRYDRVGIVGGLNPPPSSCLQTLIFEWQSALNFNPWAKFQTFRQLALSSFRSIPKLRYDNVDSKAEYSALMTIHGRSFWHQSKARMGLTIGHRYLAPVDIRSFVCRKPLFPVPRLFRTKFRDIHVWTWMSNVDSNVCGVGVYGKRTTLCRLTTGKRWRFPTYYVITIPHRHRRTDRQTTETRQLATSTCHSNTALCVALTSRVIAHLGVPVWSNKRDWSIYHLP